MPQSYLEVNNCIDILDYLYITIIYIEMQYLSIKLQELVQTAVYTALRINTTVFTDINYHYRNAVLLVFHQKINIRSPSKYIFIYMYGVIISIVILKNIVEFLAE